MPLLTDINQIEMAYALWINGQSEGKATFELFFRRNAFGGMTQVNERTRAERAVHVR